MTELPPAALKTAQDAPAAAPAAQGAPIWRGRIRCGICGHERRETTEAKPLDRAARHDCPTCTPRLTKLKHPAAQPGFQMEG